MKANRGKFREKPQILQILREAVHEALATASDPGAAWQEIRSAVQEAARQAGAAPDCPLERLRWIKAEQIRPNDYNPNAVARTEMALLRRSIEQDGITQPIVVARDGDRYTIIDGAHRFAAITGNPALLARHRGRIPCVVLDKTPAQRMAATVRHNRARGRHGITGMANLVFRMLDQGLEDADICSELGMGPEELTRIKHVTGFSKLWADTNYRQAWMTRNQIAALHEYQRGEIGQGPGEPAAGTRAPARPKAD